MSQYVDTRCKAFTCGAAIAQYLRVKFSSGKMAAAGAADLSIGTMEEASFADLDVRPVRLRSAMGTRKMVANGAITQGAPVYGAASGKISATVGPCPEGIALEAAAADGDVIEVLVADIGIKIARGQLTTVTATDTVVTGLNTVVAVVACLDDNPGDNPMLVSATIGDQAGAPAAGSIIIKTWQNTTGTDPTPLAATTFSKKVNWIAIGT